MASVQELIQAAQARQKPSPFSQLAQLINAGSEGYTKGLAIRKANMDMANTQSEIDARKSTAGLNEEVKRAELMKTLIEQQQIEQQMQAQEEMRKQIESQMGMNSERDLRNRQSGVAPKPMPTTPVSKFEETITQDEKGQYSRVIKPITPKEPVQKYDKVEYVDPVSNEKKIGRWNSVEGRVETSPTDVLAENQKSRSLASNETTFNLYETARDGMMDALKNSATGPVMGRLPAMTANAQIAEGGIAAMAPVLKQLFRSAGEGVFTDRDQALLLDMVPKRSDHQEAAVKKIENIDAIVKAKLGMTAQNAPTAGQPTTAGKIRVKRLSDGKTGTINETDFDPAKYERN